jgi:hypothetical protein
LKPTNFHNFGRWVSTYALTKREQWKEGKRKLSPSFPLLRYASYSLYHPLWTCWFMHKAVYIICKYVACTYVLWKDSNPNGENEVTSREHMPAKTRNTYVQWCAGPKETEGGGQRERSPFPPISSDELALLQPGGRLYPPYTHISTHPPGFLDSPAALMWRITSFHTQKMKSRFWSQLLLLMCCLFHKWLICCDIFNSGASTALEEIFSLHFNESSTEVLRSLTP